MPVDIVHFNPDRRPPGLMGRLRSKRPLNNFGDVIGPLLVDQIVRERRLTEPTDSRRLVAVGSIMRLARPGDVVWGTGINGKSMDTGAGPQLDIRAVRGPLTRKLLLDAGAEVPAVYGDPALLWPRYFPRANYQGTRRRITVIPNYNDLRFYRNVEGVVDPREPIHDVISAIVNSDFVCGTSLHAIVLAEAYGVPARLIRSSAEPDFKYSDYYQGTGRSSHNAASTTAEAIGLGGEPAPSWDSGPLLDSFPADLWLQPGRA